VAVSDRNILEGSAVPAFATNPGTYYFCTSNNTMFFNAVGGAGDWEVILPESGPYREEAYLIPRSQCSDDGELGRTAQTNFDGASAILERRVLLNRLTIRTAAYSATPTLSIGIYQNPGGVCGTSIPRVINVTTAAVAGGNQAITTTISETELDEGLIFILIGRDSVGGNFSFRGLTMDSFAVFNSVVPTGVNAYPTSFTTTLACSAGPPATLDPRQVADGGDATAVTWGFPWVLMSKV
jgi:hypothetical protein